MSCASFSAALGGGGASAAEVIACFEALRTRATHESGGFARADAGPAAIGIHAAINAHLCGGALVAKGARVRASSAAARRDAAARAAVALAERGRGRARTGRGSSSHRELGVRVEQQLAQWSRGWPHFRYAGAPLQRAPHRFTRRVVNALVERLGVDMRAVLFQVPVAIAAHGVRTCVDMVCVNRARTELVLIELKTGGDDAFARAAATRARAEPNRALCARALFADVARAPPAYRAHPRNEYRARCFFQLAWSALAFERTYGVAPTRALLLVANDSAHCVRTDEAHVHALPDWATRASFVPMVDAHLGAACKERVAQCT
jgi:hypothetical protein